MQNINRTPPSTRGFSLIELLVTISIISVLIGILLPALPRVLDSARRTACSANLRSVGQIVDLYRGDNRDFFPTARYMGAPWLSTFDDPDQEDFRPGFPEAMAQYIEPQSDSYRCPGDAIVSVFEYTDPETGERRESGSSYTYVAGLSGQTFPQTFFARFLNFQPFDTPVMYDFDGGLFETDPDYGESREILVDFFHTKRNIVFVDGHVGNFAKAGVQNQD